MFVNIFIDFLGICVYYKRHYPKKEGKYMPVKKIFVNLLGIMLIAFLSLPARAEMVRVAFFKETAIPFGLKYKDIVLDRKSVV